MIHPISETQFLGPLGKFCLLAGIHYSTGVVYRGSSIAHFHKGLLKKFLSLEVFGKHILVGLAIE